MADYTDSPFCRICREEAGSGFVVFREMVSSEALVRNNEKTLRMCEFVEEERPIVIQIFGGVAKVISEAVQIVDSKFKPDGIDINMGCPVPKIAGKANAGAALMKNYKLAMEILQKTKKNNPDIFLSVKTRLGWTDKNDILEFAPKLEEAGAQMLTIHGRTKKDGYSGVADWEMIGKVKKIVNIPVIANGDITSKRDIDSCLSVSKADGVMIGRGALGNPWIFGNVEPTEKQKIETILKHARYHLEHYNTNSLVTFRKHLLYYFKGEKGVKEMRKKLVKVSNYDELKTILRG